MDDKVAPFIKMLQEEAEGGAYVGRLAPMHLGHQVQTEILTTAFPNKHLLLAGSCSHAISIRHLFTYSDRVKFIKVIFPGARIAPLADFESDDDWFHAMDSLLELAGMDPSRTVFIGGSEEDVSFYHGRGRKVKILNRFDGITVDVSGSKVRDSLIQGRPLDGMVDPRIIPLVQETFRQRWAEVVKR